MRAFPKATFTEDDRVYRAHNTANGPWFFSSDGRGRFDLRPPRGTVYFADTVPVAVREHLGDTIVQAQMVSEHRARQMQVSVLLNDARLTYANVCDPRASGFSITRELCTMTDYTVTQAWAALFASHQFDGIRCAARYSTGKVPDAWARFGPAGPHHAGVVLSSETVAGADACKAAGIQVLSTPKSRSSLRVN